MNAPRHIGIASITAEGGALAYREIVHASELVLGKNRHPEISLHSHSFSKFIDTSEPGGKVWEDLIVESSAKLASVGAKFFICPANTNHVVFDRAQSALAIPWLHIADIVATRAAELGCKRTLLLGTQTLMRSTVYPPFFSARNIELHLPEKSEQEDLNRIIYEELVRGRVTETSRNFVERLIKDSIIRHRCDSVILGCTELPLLLEGSSADVAVLDSTRLIAHGAIASSVGLSLSEVERLITIKSSGEPGRGNFVAN